MTFVIRDKAEGFGIRRPLSGIRGRRRLLPSPSSFARAANLPTERKKEESIVFISRAANSRCSNTGLDYDEIRDEE